MASSRIKKMLNKVLNLEPEFKTSTEKNTGVETNTEVVINNNGKFKFKFIMFRSKQIRAVILLI